MLVAPLVQSVASLTRGPRVFVVNVTNIYCCVKVFFSAKPTVMHVDCIKKSILNVHTKLNRVVSLISLCIFQEQMSEVNRLYFLFHLLASLGKYYSYNLFPNKILLNNWIKRMERKIYQSTFSHLKYILNLSFWILKLKMFYASDEITYISIKEVN